MKGVRPADYPPPFSEAEAVGAPTDAPDERIDVGILIVGGGPGGLACAVRLGQLLEEHPEAHGDVPVRLLVSAEELDAARDASEALTEPDDQLPG